MDDLIRSTTSVAMAIVGVAILAVLVSRNNNTAGVIQSATAGFGNVLGVAMGGTAGQSGIQSYL